MYTWRIVINQDHLRNKQYHISYKSNTSDCIKTKSTVSLKDKVKVQAKNWKIDLTKRADASGRISGGRLCALKEKKRHSQHKHSRRGSGWDGGLMI